MDALPVLRSPFDVETHKATFTNYLEVVIAPSGAIVYAHPSHVDVMARMANLRGIGSDDCPRDRWLDYDGWLREVTGCVCVWNEGYLGEPNDRQEESIRMLVREGLLGLEKA